MASVWMNCFQCTSSWHRLFQPTSVWTMASVQMNCCQCTSCWCRLFQPTSVWTMASVWMNCCQCTSSWCRLFLPDKCLDHGQCLNEWWWIVAIALVHGVGYFARQVFEPWPVSEWTVMNSWQCTDESSVVLQLLSELVSKPDSDQNDDIKMMAQKLKQR